MDYKITRDQAAASRRKALSISDNDARYPDGHHLTRYSRPIDTGVRRTFGAPMAIRAVLHRQTGCKCDECDEHGYCVGCDCAADEQQFYAMRLSGIASVTDVGYEMWDMFGPYTERVSPTAFDMSLQSQPDTTFLANHEGLSMARTVNNTLTLASTPLGLSVEAWVNIRRHDVHNLCEAIKEGSVNQMSFAAFLEEGEWNDGCDEFMMTRLDLHCGDVSAVNFGANPHTSIAARSHHLIDEIERLPSGAARVAMRQLETRLGTAPRIKGVTTTGLGRSTSLVQSALMAALET
jgi:HK97 family phage prohead protease